YARWGNVAGWSRMEADPDIYGALENRLGSMFGGSKIHLSMTITMLGFSIVPAIVQKGMIFADKKLHTVVWEACRLARDHGAQISRFEHQNMADLERLLIEHRDVSPKMIAVDGVYSISTELAPIKELQALCAKYDAWLYVDDAHGFGILGQGPTSSNPYGTGGSGVVNYFGGDYDRTFYVSGFAKAFCSSSAFTTIPRLFKDNLRSQSLSYLFSNPVSPYTIGTVQAVLDLNEKIGEQARETIRANAGYFMAGLNSLGLKALNNLEQPVVFLEAGTFPQLVAVAEKFWSSGIVAGLRAYPVVPPDQCGLRFALSPLHTRAHLDHVLNVLSDLKGANAIQLKEASGR
ncbi:MAG: pyridoxal phosphate-dependent aminotransferase family protein, partial [Bdellovibrionia bacterium]